MGTLLTLSMMMVFYLLMSSMAGYAVARFTAGDSESGFAASSFVLAAVIGRIFTGKYLDFVGRKNLLVGSMLVFALASGGYFVAGSLWLLVAVRLVHGIAFGAGNTAIMTAIQAIIPPPRRAEGTGYVSLAVTLATSFGPFLGVFLPEHFSYTIVFVASTVFSVITLGFTLLISLPEVPPTPQQRADKWRLRLNTIVDPVGLKIGMIVALGGVAYAAALVFLAGYTDHKDIPAAASGFFIAYAGASFVSRLVVGRIQDAYGDNIVIYPVLVCFVASNIVIAAVPTVWGITVAGLLEGLGLGSLIPCAQAIVVMNVGRQRVPVATASYFLLLDTGTGIGPVILGGLIPVISQSGMYVLAAALVAVSIVVYYLNHGRHASPRAVGDPNEIGTSA